MRTTGVRLLPEVPSILSTLTQTAKISAATESRSIRSTIFTTIICSSYIINYQQQLKQELKQQPQQYHKQQQQHQEHLQHLPRQVLVWRILI